MNIVFIGSSKFGKRCLERVITLPGINVSGIVTNEEVFSISYNRAGVKNVLYADIASFADNLNIPVWKMKEKMTEPGLVEQIKQWAPDFILVVGWYHMVPEAIREIAPAGALHSSLLPDYSGGAPLVWAIINGEEKTGITFFLMDKGVDNGPVIGQREQPIFFEDTIATLYARIEEDGIKLIEENLPLIAQGKAAFSKQDESKRRLMPQRSPDDGKVNWNSSPLEIYNFIRAQTKPYPGAFSFLNGKKITFWSSVIISNTVPISSEPGTLVSRNESGVLVATAGQAALLLKEIGIDGKDMPAASYFKETDQVIFQ